ncbi:uncharacterized protein N7503_000812 [Penicillium pulvis]|uniref:uncharacterized protein n=1 Tax=Penicillium pulvis TaxID=1562058 RepID=UPI002546EFFB|nr:uncharacterized protein N7503_000812 [Penicillium pulvis]KAJ5814062.1 hypothetical protein N7503_000812 [Penicillium pulvis]
MSHTVDLGQCLLHATKSQLQLQFTATASLGHNTNSACEADLSPPHWPHPASTWIREAPELELRFFVRFGPGLEPIACSLISRLEKMLSCSTVWLDLGFSIAPKSHGITMNTDRPGERFLVLGLCREMTGPKFTKRRSLPAILQNPPDTQPPPEVPIVSLAAIEIYLECGYLFRPDEHPEELSVMIGTETEPRYSADFFASCSDSPTNLTLDLPAGFTGFAERDSIPKGDIVDQSSRNFLALVDFGLQELLSSAGTKCSDIKVIENSLQALHKLAPVIFNPGYREAMNERAISCPIIAKAVNSMLANTSNPILQKEVSNIPVLRKQWIGTTLWRMGQAHLLHLKGPKACGSFLSHRSSINELQPNGDPAVLASSAGDVFGEEDILDLDEAWDLNTGNECDYDDPPQIMQTDFDDESDGPLLGSSGESSFRDLYESTQTTLDSLPVSQAVSLPHTDSDMLLFDCELG